MYGPHQCLLWQWSGYSVKTGALRPQQKIIIIIIEYMFFRNILIDVILRQVDGQLFIYALLPHCTFCRRCSLWLPCGATSFGGHCHLLNQNQNFTPQAPFSVRHHNPDLHTNTNPNANHNPSPGTKIAFGMCKCPSTGTENIYGRH